MKQFDISKWLSATVITSLTLMLVSCAQPTEQSPVNSLSTTTANETVSEAMLVDAGMYAKQIGVSLDEAVRRMKFQDLAGSLGGALVQNESETLVAHWIEHQPEFKVVVVFTHDGEQTVRKYLAADSPLWEVLEIRNQARVTEAQLQAEQQETMTLLQKLGLYCDSATDIKEGQVEVYVTDSKLFNETLEKAGVKLPEHVVQVVVYEPLSGPPPFPINPDPSIHFPQMKTQSMSGMSALMVGDMTVRNGYLYVGDHLVVWQPDYFVNSDNGTIEILNREGKVVAREGEEVVMGGGGVPLNDQLNQMLKEPLPAGIVESVWVQGSGMRLSLNLNSDLFGLEVIPAGDHQFYFLTVKPTLNAAITEKITITGTFTAGSEQYWLRSPMVFSDEKPEESKASVQYTTYWPEGYTARVTDGVFEVVDKNEVVVVWGGDRVTIEGRVLYSFNSTASKLSDELPGGLSGPHLIVDKVVK